MPHIRDEVLSKLNKQEFYESYGLVLRVSGSSLVGKCPFHDDENPSLSIDTDTGLFFCHACGAKGSPFDFVMKKDGVDFSTALHTLADRVGTKAVRQPEVKAPAPEIPEDKPKTWHDRLMASPEQLKFLMGRRGLSRDTIIKFGLGWDGERYTIPIRDAGGRLQNIRKYKPEAQGRDKMISHTEVRGKNRFTYGKARLLPAEPQQEGIVVIAEGEMDCILAIQEGFNAITATSGAGIWNSEWNKVIEDRDIVLAYDNDRAGKVGAQRVASMIFESVKSVRILNWPAAMPDKGDITDWLASLCNTPSSLQELIDKARSYKPHIEESEKEPENISIVASGSGEHTGHKVRMRVMVSGKDTSPFLVPGIVEATCDMANGKACDTCGMQLRHGGQATVEFRSKDRETLGLLRCSDEQQKGFIRKRVGAPARCLRLFLKTAKTQTVEEIQVIPEVNGKLQQNDEGEYVTRTMYAMMQGVKANSVYDVVGYPFPDVRDQHATCLLGILDGVQTSIDSFELKENEIEELKIFQPVSNQTVDEKMYEIAKDLECVHNIRNRPELTIALDLGWHSVLSFNCFGEFQPKGWVEIFILGDSGQGKSKISLALCDYYHAGQRIQAEQSSSAGLVGGLAKHADRWHITWGPIVLNDRRLLVIDEWSGVKEEDAERLTDIRSTGIAEIIKIHRERAWARTRLIFLSNPKEGRPLASYENGCEALFGLFKKSEDIRRIDLAMCVASGQVDLGVLNSMNEQRESRYSSDSCSNLVLWAWSRKPSQIIFTDDAQVKILQYATYLSNRYSSKLPLIEPADTRWKIARLSASTAARTFSTTDGKSLIVTPSHVEFAVGFMERCYKDRSMGYASLSRQHLIVEKYVQDNRDDIIQGLRSRHPNPRELIEFFMSERTLSPKDMETQLGLTKEDVRDLMRYCSQKRLVERTKYGFRKRPAFIMLLHYVEESDVDLSPTANPKLDTSVSSDPVEWEKVELV